jgi:hypothetical protein
MTLNKLERLLMGLCFVLLAVIAYLLGYSNLISSSWSTGLMTAATTLALQVLWPSKFKRAENGGFPFGVDQK